MALRASPERDARTTFSMSSQNSSHFASWRAFICIDASRNSSSDNCDGKRVLLATPFRPRPGRRIASRTSVALISLGSCAMRSQANSARTIDRCTDFMPSWSWVGMSRSTSTALTGIRLALTRDNTAMSLGSVPAAIHSSIRSAASSAISPLMPGMTRKASGSWRAWGPGLIDLSTRTRFHDNRFVAAVTTGAGHR